MADGWGRVLLSIYSGGGRVLLPPLLPVLLRRRASRGHEEPARIRERHGHASAARPSGDLVWVHAASVGETNAVAGLVRRLRAFGHPILFTTVTVTGAATAQRMLPEGAVHQYFPVDGRQAMRRFLDHWRPAAALFVESEVWPVLTDELWRRRVPHVVVNGRMSARSFGQWKWIGGGSKAVFGKIALVLAQTEPDATRFAALGVRKATALGNLKFDAAPPAAKPEILEELRQAIGGRPVWLAASTHPGEDEMVIAAHKEIAARIDDLVTIVVPRHPERGPSIATLAAAGDVSVTVRSRGEAIPAGAGLYVADTLGELGLFYRLAPVAFVGGSLTDRGGQNPIEAVHLGAAVLHGPDTPNFAEVYGVLDQCKGAVIVRDARELAAMAGGLLEDAPRRRAQCAAAERALEPFAGALDRTMAALASLLPIGRLAG